MDKKIDHILFDFDGTIANTLPLAFELYNEIADQYNFISADHSELAQLMNMSISEILNLKNIPLYMVPIALINVKKKMKQRISEVKPFAGIKAFLGNLKQAGFHLSVISSNSKENMIEFFEMHDINVFNYIYSSTSLFGKDKLIKHYLKAVKTSAENVIYVGDEIRDIEAARASNIKIISVTWGYNDKDILSKHKPDYLVDTLDAVEEILQISN
ncbi:MAG: HAD-IA family hydrolase [Candidatus Cloacimonadales bacterium]